MTSPFSSRLVLALLANVAVASGACGGFGSEPPANSSGPDEQAPPGSSPGTDPNGGPKAPPVGGPASQNELTDDLGVFVSPTGQDAGDGTHARPLATIQSGIDRAKAAGKRVYVCAGTYHEALTIADSISVIGGLDCTNNEWRTGPGVSRVEAPTSPAIRAKDITSATRLEGLDVKAPDATVPSGSSIGLLAEQASALVVARSKVVAGNGMKGDDGTDGIQLSNAATANGGAAIVAAECTAFSACANTPSYKPPVTPAGTNICQGAPGIESQPGGFGGSGGKWEVYTAASGKLLFKVYQDNISFGAGGGVTNRTSAAGADGNPGSNAAALGTFTQEGYVPADGQNGTNGSWGFGGAGGAGYQPDGYGNYVGAIWHGTNGASGGAGGCPGLAGTGGKGGGASVAAFLVESAVTFDGSELLAGSGGDAGLGAFGSVPTPGGLAGPNPSGFGNAVAQPGGRGGLAGISGNGSTGPSVAIAHLGAAPKLLGTSKATPGAGGAAVAERTRTDLGVLKTIPATPAGLSKDILAL